MKKKIKLKQMKFKIEMIVEGGQRLKDDLEKGFGRDAAQEDLFFYGDEKILEFKFEEIKETKTKTK